MEVTGTEEPLRLGLIKSKRAITTLDSALSLDFVLPVVEKRLDDVLATISDPALGVFRDRLIGSKSRIERISPKLGQWVLRRIAEVPANGPSLSRIAEHLRRPRRYADARALQADALSLALKAFGAHEAGAIALTSEPSALGAIRLQEDAVIEHDARWMPGWTLSESDLTGRATFRRFGAQLDVFTANKRPLERLLGVDLIYLNKARGSLVMVQYKMMEPGKVRRRDVNDPYDDGDREWNVGIDAQFLKELDRMRRFDQDLEPDGSYRLHSGGFFFKFVKRNALTNSAGILISLGHLEQLMQDGELRGPGGGLRVSYERLAGHYLRTDPFVDLVSSGYVGTRGATTRHLESLIDAALTGGNAVVAAVQTALRHSP